MKPVSANMLVVLRHIACGLSPWEGCSSMSLCGGRTCTLGALYRSGLINKNYDITELGQLVLWLGLLAKKVA
jgi:hypothetical protein